MVKMRLKSEIMPMENSLKTVSVKGSGAQDINVQIILELLLNIRQLSAAIFVIANGGELNTPPWLKKIAEGK